MLPHQCVLDHIPLQTHASIHFQETTQGRTVNSVSVCNSRQPYDSRSIGLFLFFYFSPTKLVSSVKSMQGEVGDGVGTVCAETAQETHRSRET